MITCSISFLISFFFFEILSIFYFFFQCLFLVLFFSSFHIFIWIRTKITCKTLVYSIAHAAEQKYYGSHFLFLYLRDNHNNKLHVCVCVLANQTIVLVNHSHSARVSLSLSVATHKQIFTIREITIAVRIKNAFQNTKTFLLHYITMFG